MRDARIDLIQRTMAGFRVEKWQLLNRGANSEAFLVNGEFIFRFPLKSDIDEEYEIEEKILSLIRPFIESTKIPQITLCQDRDGKILFSQHRIIKGVDYCRAAVKTAADKRVIARQLAKFCHELHSIDISKFDFLELKQLNPAYLELDGKNAELAEILGDDFTGDLDEKLDFLYGYNNFKPKDNVLCHTDLHEENILIADDGLAGVIDFGNALLRNRNVEFSNILQYDAEFGFMVIEEYEKLLGRNLDMRYIYCLQRLKCYSYLLYFKRCANEKYVNLFRGFVKNLNVLDSSKLLVDHIRIRRG